MTGFHIGGVSGAVPMPERESALRPEILLRNAGWLRGLARQLVRDEAAADDVVQETWLKALANAPRSQEDGPGLRAWLARVARNVAHSDRRSAAQRTERESSVARPEATPAAVETAARMETHRRLLAAADALEEPYRTAIRMRWFDGLPPREIAAQLGVAPHVVWTRLSRAHSQLRERLEERHGGRRAMVLALAGMSGAGDVGRGSGGIAAGTAAAVTGGIVGMTTKVAAGAVVAGLLALWWMNRDPVADIGAPAAAETDTATQSDVPSRPRVVDEKDVAPEGMAAEPDAPDKVARPITARVVDAETGATIEGASLLVAYRELINFLGHEFEGTVVEGSAVGDWTSFDLRETTYPRSLLQLQEMYVIVTADGYAAHVDTFRPFSNEGEHIDLGEVALGRGVVISGRVRSGATGGSLAGAQMYVTRPTQRFMAAALGYAMPAGTSDADGTFTLDRPALPVNRSQVIVVMALTNEGVGARELYPRGDGDVDDVEIIVQSAPLTVIVRDANGAAVSGAFVTTSFRAGPFRASDLPGASGWLGPHAELRELIAGQTDADGVLRLTTFPVIQKASRIDVVANAPGHASATALDVSVGPGGATIELALRPDAERSIVGRVVDESGAPVSDAEVAFVEVGTPKGPTTTSAADGTFRLTDFGFRGDWQIQARASHDRAGRADVMLPRDGVVDAGDLIVRRAAAVTGRVTNAAGEPVPRVGIVVFLHGESHAGLTENDGSFRIEDITDGEWNLDVRARSFGGVHYDKEPLRLVRAGDDVQVMVRALPTGDARLVLSMVDAKTGAAIHSDDVDVMLLPVEGTQRHGGITVMKHRDGPTIERVAPGRWRVWARVKDYVPTFVSVTVEEGVREVRATVRFGSGATLAGTVDTAAIPNFRNVTVMISPMGQRSLPGGAKWWHRPPHGHTRTSSQVEEGRFSFDRLPPGRWKIRLLGPGIVGAAEVVLTDAQTTPVVVTARRGAIVRFHGDAVVAPGHALVAVARPGEEWQERTGGRGKGETPFTAALTLEPGRWRWRVRFPTDPGPSLTMAAETQEGEIDVAGGDDITLDVPVTAR